LLLGFDITHGYGNVANIAGVSIDAFICGSIAVFPARIVSTLASNLAGRYFDRYCRLCDIPLLL